MQGYQIRRVIIVIVAVLLLVLIVSQVAKVFRNITGDSSGLVQTASVIDVKEYANPDSKIYFTYDGSIIAPEDHRLIKFTISADQRIIEIMRGYDGVVINRKSYPNTLKSYETFIRAIDYEGFDTDKSNNLGNDERGICPSGTRQVYELFNNHESVFKTWSVSCSKKLGTFDGDSRSILKLFQKQIPDYSELTKGVKF